MRNNRLGLNFMAASLPLIGFSIWDRSIGGAAGAASVFVIGLLMVLYTRFSAAN